MFKKNDPNTFSKYCSLMNGPDEKDNIIGTIFSEYQVSSYDDVQLKSFDIVTKSTTRKFLVQCSQRINIFNKEGMELETSNNLNSYELYPVMLNTTMSIKPDKVKDKDEDKDEGISFQLLEYAPQTVNTKIQSSGTSGESNGKTSGTSRNDTVGSTTSQTNSYGTSVSMGFQGDILSGGVTASSEHSETSSHEQSHTSGSESSRSMSNEISSSASMSIKDWGAYSLVNPSTKSPSWTFGQEYPWDVIECKKTKGKPYPYPDPNKLQDYQSLTEIVIPLTMQARLYDGVSLYPPSQLSMFGVNFIMKSSWLVTLNNSASDFINIEHELFYYRGAHCLIDNETTVSVYRDHQPAVLQVKSGEGESLVTKINLPIMALDAIGKGSSSAIIGFIPNKFTVKPAPPVHFKIVSGANNLLITDTTTYPNPCAGAGFTADETALTANFAANCVSLQAIMYFKITDNFNNYKLYLKHWKTGAMGIKLTITINGDKGNSIVKYVDALEAEGGENNLLVVALRDLNFSSVDYHDYLQLGLNSIQLTIEPIGGQYTTDCGYQIRAISIEND